VTHLRGGDAADDDLTANRTIQGALRQFVRNANGIVGANRLRFTPAVATNQSGGGGAWWRLSVTTALPSLADSDTTIDGTAYSSVNGTTVRDDNPGQLGAGGTAGVDALALSQLDKPELEIFDVRSTTVVPIGLDLQGARSTLRRVAIYGFGATPDVDTSANVRVGANATATLIELAAIGTAASSFADPGAANRSGGDNIRVTGADGGTISKNLVGFATGSGIVLRNASNTWLLEGNEVRGNAFGRGHLRGIGLEDGSASATVRGNLVIAHDGPGIDTPTTGGSHTIVNNTIRDNGVGPDPDLDGQPVVNPGVRLSGALSIVDRNVLTANHGAGILVASTATDATLTRNSIFDNGIVLGRTGGAASAQIGIDLLAAANNAAKGTAPFLTLNDNGDPDAGGNGLFNMPVITSARIVSGNLVMDGFARPGSVIELFIVAADPSGFGEGQTYLTTLTEGSGADTDAGTGSYGPGAINGVAQGTDNTNRFAFALPVPGGVAIGTKLTATARNASGGTSEFSGNVTVTLPQTDLVTTKTDGVVTAVPGTDLVYTIQVQNAGPDPVSAASVTDTFNPAIFNILNVGWTCAITTGTGACGAASGPGNIATTVDLNAGAVATYTVTARIRSGATGTIVNTASAAVPGTSIDPVPGNNSATDNDTVLTPQSDLHLTKTDGVVAASPGTNVTYTITVTNGGPSDAVGATVTDTLAPAFFNVAGATWTCAITSGTGSCGAPGGAGNLSTTVTLQPTAVATFTIVAPILASASGTLSNTALVTSPPGNTDPVPADNSATDSDTQIVSSADLAVTKTDGLVSSFPGASITYTITVHNFGPGNAAGAIVTDTLDPAYFIPANAVWTCAVPPGQGACGAAGGTGNIATTVDLIVGGTATVTVNATVRQGATGTIVNTATAGMPPGSNDPTPGNDSGTDGDTALTPLVNLSLAKTVDVPAPAVGANVTFTITVQNASGYSDASSVVVSDLLPAGYAFVSDDGAGSYVPATGVWSVGNVTAGGSRVLHVTARVLGSGTYVNAAEVTSAAQSDFDDTYGNGAGNDYATATTTPSPSVDLSLTKTVSQPTPAVGTNVTFTITVQNAAGYSNATGVVVTDLLPGGYTYVSDDGAGSYVPGTGVWSVGNVPAGGSRVLHVTARVLGSGSYANTAEVTAADQPDPNDVYGNGSGNDFASVAPAPVPTVDLSMAKTIDQPAPSVGTNVTFTITVSNATGFSDATGVVVTDLLPGGYTHVGNDGAGSYVPATGVWSVGNVPAGGSRVLHVTATVLGSGSYTNAAEVTAAGQPDANDTYGDGAGNDRATATANPSGAVDLSLTKIVNQPTPAVGSNVIFTITVTNAAGYSPATGVVVTDLLPGGYAYVGDDGAGSYVAATGVWSVGNVAAGGSRVLHVTAAVLGSGSYTNTAEVTAAAQPDANDTYGNGAGNDFGAVTPAPIPTVDLTMAKSVNTPVPSVGSSVIFTITVSNAAGFSNATGVVVTDQLPNGYTYVSDDGAGSYVPATGVWTVGNLAAGASRVLHVTATVRASGVYTNAAEVTAANQPDTDDTYGDGVGTDHATATANPNGTADLSLLKTVDEPTPAVGTTVTFTLRVSNALGFTDASGVVVTDLLPDGYAYVSDDGAGLYVPGTGVWNVGDVAAGGFHVVHITALVLPTGTYTNEAEVTAADQPDANDLYGDGAGNDFASVTPAPVPTVDLSLSKIVDQPTPAVGTNVTFTITVQNAAGFSEATGVIVTDVLPNGYGYVSDDGAGSYVPATGLWSVGNVAASSSRVLHVTAVVLGSGLYTNAAEVTSSDQPDANDTYGNGSGDDFGSVTPVPLPRVDLSLSKVVDQPTPAVGTNVVFTITVQNAAGFTNATGVVVNDVLPNGYSYLSDDGAGSYAPVTGVWSVGNVAAGGSRVLHVTARVLGSGSYTNAAQVTAAAQPDANDTYGDGAGNDFGSVSPVPVPTIDLALSKAVDVPNPSVGSNVVFTITVSNAAGFTDATGVVVTDLLPNGYVYVGDDGAGSYVAATGVWSVGQPRSRR
jgi:uncharacterized repeat protein (TIGR01451 family)